MIVYFVDEVAKVQGILPELLTMVTDGLVEAHPTEVLKDISTAEKVIA
jgi:PII-like signaling protein